SERVHRAGLLAEEQVGGRAATFLDDLVDQVGVLPRANIDPDTGSLEEAGGERACEGLVLAGVEGEGRGGGGGALRLGDAEDERGRCRGRCQPGDRLAPRGGNEHCLPSSCRAPGSGTVRL